MSREYHKWVARDVQREEPREMTEKEKRANWWDYHWKHVALGALLLVFIGWLTVDLIYNKNNQPDCQITYIGTAALTDDTVAALKEQLAPLIGDVDGNGEIIIQLQQHIISPDNDNYAADDPDQQMAMVAQLAANESFLFLLEDPAAFQERYGLLTYGDGTHPDEGGEREEPLWYPWAQCPILAGLDLGASGADGEAQTLLSDLCIGRTAINSWSEEQAEAYTALWNSLIAGAESQK